MPEAYIGEIRLFAGNYAPQGWAKCDGRALPVSGNEALFTLIGTIWGGNQVTFNLPNLSGRVPIGAGQGPGLSARTVGNTGGAEGVLAELPLHGHHFFASAQPATQTAPAGQMLATVTPNGTTAGLYLKVPGTEQVMADDSILESGGSAAHANTMPSLGLGYIISLFGEFPTRD